MCNALSLFTQSYNLWAIIVFQGANFRDLKGVRVGENNTVEFDPDIPRVLLSSGKPLVLLISGVLLSAVIYIFPMF
jgi:hypothetical protein